MRSLYVIKSGFSLEIQDMGRPGYLEQGLSRSGVADRFAMAEANALLDQKGNLATLEMLERRRQEIFPLRGHAAPQRGDF